MPPRFQTLLHGPPPSSSSWFVRSGIALGSTAVALLCGLFLDARLGEAGAYLPLTGALAVAAWYGGVGPALLVQVAGAAITFLFIARPHPVAPVTAVDLYALLSFLAFGKLVLFLTANLHWNVHLRQNRRDLEMIAHATHDCLWEWDLVRHKVYRNGNVQRIYGEAQSKIPNTIEAWRKRLHQDDSRRVWNSLCRAVETGQDQWEEEYRLRRSDGSYIFVSDHGMVIQDKRGKSVRMIGGMADISAQKRAEEQLIYSASHDTLTGLPNREFFLTQVKNAILSRQPGDEEVLAVLFLDIDRFKVVNDSLGHSVGDQLLSAVARRLQESLHPDHIAARFGGDEFTVLLQGLANLEAIIARTEQIQDALAMPIEFDEHHIVITVSIGVALAGISDTPEDLIRHADIAMYRAKMGGKARHVIFEPAIDMPAKDLLQLETDIRQALKQRCFRLFYQPIISLKTGEIVSFEALLRWEHARRGLLLPADFLFIAEEAGLTVPLSQWIIGEACRSLTHWHQVDPTAERLRMNINLSEKQFMQPLVVQQVKQALDESGLNGEFITLELTETMMIENSESMLNRLRHLRNLGLQLAIDDFGKGYSSLGRLQEFPISILKIDASFIHQIDHGRPQIVDAIIALAHQLALQVTAEGIETEQQAAHLAAANCTNGQGFFFSPALEQDAVPALLQRHPRWNVPSTPARADVKMATNSTQ